jgi:hypothetical protein
MARVLVPVTSLTPPKAALTTAITGTNNDLVFTAKVGGPAGNSIRVQYVVAGASTPLTISVQGFDIIVNVATSAGSAATSTSAEIKSALDANFDVTRLITVAHAASNDGTGVVAAMSITALAGGSLQVTPPTQINGDATNGHYFTANDGLTTLEVVSSDAGAQTVSILYSPYYAPIATVASQVESVPAGATRRIGPFLSTAFDQNSTNDVYFNCSVSTNLKFRAYTTVRAS